MSDTAAQAILTTRLAEVEARNTRDPAFHRAGLGFEYRPVGPERDRAIAAAKEKVAAPLREAREQARSEVTRLETSMFDHARLAIDSSPTRWRRHAIPLVGHTGDLRCPLPLVPGLSGSTGTSGSASSLDFASTSTAAPAN